MPTFVDFIGLNTFVFDPISASNGQNTIGYPTSLGVSIYENVEVVRIASGNINPTGSTATDARRFREGLATLVPTLLLKRSGPYGYCSWKQLRVSDNPLTRYHNRNSDFTFVREPGDSVNILSDINLERNVRNRYSNIHQFEEPPVSSKTYPLVWNVGHHKKIRNNIEEIRFSIQSSYANQLLGFSNEKVNSLLGYQLKDDDLEYERIKEFYLKGGLQFEDSPLTIWDFMKYKETVYPQAKNMYRKEVRSRQNFPDAYNDYRPDRSVIISPETDSSAKKRTFGFVPSFNDSNTLITASNWPLDVPSDWSTRDAKQGDYLPMITPAGSTVGPGATGRIDATSNAKYGPFNKAPGVLMNNHAQITTALFEGTHHSSMTPAGLFSTVPNSISYLTYHRGVAPYYARRHTLRSTGSVSNPSGLVIAETSSISSGSISDKRIALFQGNALWETATQAGKHPYPNSYAEWSQDVRLIGKNYSLVPEFRMSEHVQNILKSGSSYIPDNLFEVTGGEANNNNSSYADFYKTYSNSEFLQHFEAINEDHKNFSDSKVFTLRCHAIKKFLPYEGFYPAERTVDLAAQFSASYLPYANISKIGNEDASSWLNFLESYAGRNVNFIKQNLMVPLFAPGIMYNTIKSGIAVDFPIYITGNMGCPDTAVPAAQSLFKNVDGEHMCKKTFTANGKRVPFEALLDPSAHLADVDIKCLEPHPSGNVSSSCVWTGQGDSLYKMMINNFLAESTEFFLQDQNLSSLVSRKQTEFLPVQANKTYSMRIKMYRSMDRERTMVSGANGLLYTPPQDIILAGDQNCRETFTMYSRPSAFGPPCFGITGWDETDDVLRQIWYKDRISTPAVKGHSGADRDGVDMDSRHGYNFCYTPPYYHGEAWLDIHVKFDSGGKKSIEEIFSKMQEPSASNYNGFSQLRAFDIWSHMYPAVGGTKTATITSGEGPQSFRHDNINKNAMQLTSSVNVFGVGKLRSKDLLDDDSSKEVNVLVSTDDENEQRWVVQTKFETPMLNFNHIRAENSNITIPVHGSGSVPRGMWHQYGKIPNEDEGVYLQVTNIPKAWVEKTTDYTANDTGSLANLVGFSKEPIKLGRIAGAKVIREAVVAIPFIEVRGRKKFFKLNKQEVHDYLNVTIPKEDSKIGLSVKAQIDKMKRYLFPPSFDFIRYKDEVDPIAMYIFEFTHRLSQQDLADIWQNLPPSDIYEKAQTSTAVVAHPLLQKELLGSGEGDNNTPINLPSKLRWMVFKVKQKAASNYFKKVIAKEGGLGGSEAPALGRGAKDPLSSRKVQYNWPYDYFSLVELVKIDAEVEFNNADYTDFFENMPNIITKKADSSAIDLMNADPDPLFSPVRSREEWVQENAGRGPGRGVDTSKGPLTFFINAFLRHTNNGRTARVAYDTAFNRVLVLFDAEEVRTERPKMISYAETWRDKSGDTSKFQWEPQAEDAGTETTSTVTGVEGVYDTSKTERQNMKALFWYHYNNNIAAGGKVNESRKFARDQVRGASYFSHIDKMGTQFVVKDKKGEFVFYYPHDST